MLAVALLLGSADPRATVLSVGLVALVAWLLATVPGEISGHRAWAWLRDVVGATPATPLQLIYLLIVGLIALSRVLGVEILMGAILAGLVMRRFIVDPQTSEALKHLEASSYGLFVPLFFVVAGSRLDLASVVAHPWGPLLCLMGIMVIRGLPQFLLYRRALPDRRERLRFCLLVYCVRLSGGAGWPDVTPGGGGPGGRQPAVGVVAGAGPGPQALNSHSPAPDSC